MEERLYFAYGSNMNLTQMKCRCPAAALKGHVRLEDYRLEFCGKGQRYGVATIIPEKGEIVEGVLWAITPECERSLDGYEGYPYLYGKECLLVKDTHGDVIEVMAYTMNAPYREYLVHPSQAYLEGILTGCRQNGIQTESVIEAADRSHEEENARISAMENRKKNRER